METLLSHSHAPCRGLAIFSSFELLILCGVFFIIRFCLYGLYEILLDAGVPYGSTSVGKAMYASVLAFWLSIKFWCYRCRLFPSGASLDHYCAAGVSFIM